MDVVRGVSILLNLCFCYFIVHHLIAGRGSLIGGENICLFRNLAA
jgi:hypothetical protein